LIGRCFTIFLASCIIYTIYGCSSQSETLTLADLTPAEKQYIDRFITLERARAVALIDSMKGRALLDSLATAWGDSSLANTRKGLSSKPLRVEALNNLLRRILAAERDSLVLAADPDRLRAPLPDPPAESEPET